MKVSPISAAHKYTMALEAIRDAATLSDARAAAADALKTTFDRPEADEVTVYGAYGLNTRRPFVELGSTSTEVQLSTAEARRLALHILQAATNAETEGFLVTFFGRADMDDEQLGMIIGNFRAYREQQLGDAGAARSDEAG
jgi:hypothetical protein